MKKKNLYLIFYLIILAAVVPMAVWGVQTYVLPSGSIGHQTEHLTNLPNRDEALRSNFSGTSAPTTPTPVAGQSWFDTTNDQLKYRNAAASAWVQVPRMDQANTWSGAQTFNGQNTFSAQNTFAMGTITADTPPLKGSATWNNSGVTFNGILLDITDTASASASLLANLRVGGSSKFKVDKTGKTTAGADPTAALDLVTLQYLQSNVPQVKDKSTSTVTVSNTIVATTIYSFTVPANLLGTDKALRLKILGDYKNNSGGASTFEVGLTWSGASRVLLGPLSQPNSTGNPGCIIELTLAAKGATNAQSAQLEMRIGASAGSTQPMDNQNFLYTADTTVGQTITIDIKHGVANANTTYNKRYAVLELLQ